MTLTFTAAELHTDAQAKNGSASDFIPVISACSSGIDVDYTHVRLSNADPFCHIEYNPLLLA